MAIQVNRVIYFDQKRFDTTSERTSVTGEYRGTIGTILYMYSSDEDCTFKIEVKIVDQWFQIGEGTITADELEVVNVDYYVPELRVKVTPVAAPTTVTIEGRGYPIVFTRNSDGMVTC